MKIKDPKMLNEVTFILLNTQKKDRYSSVQNTNSFLEKSLLHDPKFSRCAHETGLDEKQEVFHILTLDI